MNETISQINEIRNLMERSTRFLSLSGLSGVAAGVTALIGAAVAYFYLDFGVRYFDSTTYFTDDLYLKIPQAIYFLALDGILVLIVAVGLASIFTIRKTKKSGNKIWSPVGKKLIVQLLIPLASGGFFCLLLFYHRVFFLIAPATLIFYGLALLNASKYTLREIQWLGISEIVLGLLSALMIGYGLVFWSIGFGLLHIIYGIAMYLKYDVNK
ncbi:MAG: hypothetical protein MI922_26545 [Bacteroidales bacterium]|nr:hypothetical protein [Bacteroidales bacterium]